jgi:hypothetical protein
MKTATRGGARPGAGRKPGKNTANRLFSLSLETLAALDAIPAGERSKFVEAAIRARLKRRAIARR